MKRFLLHNARPLTIGGIYILILALAAPGIYNRYGADPWWSTLIILLVGSYVLLYVLILILTLVGPVLSFLFDVLFPLIAVIGVCFALIKLVKWAWYL